MNEQALLVTRVASIGDMHVGEDPGMYVGLRNSRVIVTRTYELGCCTGCLLHAVEQYRPLRRAIEANHGERRSAMNSLGPAYDDGGRRILALPSFQRRHAELGVDAYRPQARIGCASMIRVITNAEILGET